MHYEWDKEKASANLRRHKIDFADAVGVFDDPYALSMPDATPHEQRFIALGTDLLGRTLVESIPTVVSGFALFPRGAQRRQNRELMSEV